MSNFHSFEKRIGCTFGDINLLRQAFIHRSYLNENPQEKLDHNERLEFLGDAVLELVVTDYLFRTYPDKTEGELTAYRAALVNTQSLSRAAEELGMNEYLLLSRGEAKSTGKARGYILANTLEALIGALYLDQGYRAADEFIRRELVPQLGEIVAKRLWQDAKSYFQERAQDDAGITPTYEVLREEGPDHNKIFTVGLFIGKEKVSTGEGRSKQEAEQAAARKGLVARGWQEE